MLAGSEPTFIDPRALRIKKLICYLIDTPWDEPTRGSVEFMQYITGEAFNHQPWSRFSPDALCTSPFLSISVPLFLS